MNTVTTRPSVVARYAELVQQRHALAQAGRKDPNVEQDWRTRDTWSTPSERVQALLDCPEAQRIAFVFEPGELERNAAAHLDAVRAAALAEALE